MSFSSEFNASDEELFTAIAEDIRLHGYSIRAKAVPRELATALYQFQKELDEDQFAPAGVGRGEHFQQQKTERSDSIAWISDESDIGQRWLAWMDGLQREINRRLFLGLFSYESHFAHYRPGDFYKRHLDAFKGSANRVFTTVTYLNPEWNPAHGGELVLYLDESDQEGIRVVPEMGTLVTFLSDEFPHEVLPATADRYSIAGWFRVNSSDSGRVDPPR